MQRHTLGDDGQGTGHNTSTANALDCSADDEGNGVWSAATNQGTNFEETERSQEDPVDLELNVQLAKHELEAACRQQISRAVPGHIFEGVEVACDFRDGCGNDGPVLRI